MNDLVIRDAQPADRDAIRTVTIAAYEQYGQVAPEMWEPYKASILSTLSNVAPAEQIVAERAGEIVGTVLLYPAGTILETPDGSPFAFPSPEVRLLAVVPTARGQGIGGALTRECISRAAKAGYRAITLHTTDLMQTAMQMYERMGFVRTPETDFQATPEIVVKGYKYTLE